MENNIKRLIQTLIKEEIDPRRPKDKAFDLAQQLSKLSPEDREKVAMIQQMISKEKMDKDDYGRSISGKDKRTFMEPEDSMPAARARKMAGMEDDPRATFTDDEIEDYYLNTDLPELATELGYLKEITDYDFKGSEVISRVNNKTPDLFGKQLFADILPKGSASELKAIEALKAHDDSRIKQNMDRFAPMFVHIQYHEFEHEGEKYRLHQTQYSNSNFEDKDPTFNPRVTKLDLMKLNPDTKETEDVGEMLVKTNEYVKDLKRLKITKKAM